MEPEGSLPHLEELATGPYPVPSEFSQQPYALFILRSTSMLSSFLQLGFPNCHFTSGFPSKIV
jgi:hypothetical protein